MNIDNNNDQDNQNQFLDNEVINNNYLYNNEELNYISRHTKITLSFLIVLLIKIFFCIYFYIHHNTEKFYFHYIFILNYNQYYRCITRYFINFGCCHFTLEIIITFIICYYFENKLGTLFTILFIFISMIILSFVNLGLLEIIKQIYLYYNHKNNIDTIYEGGLTPLFFTFYTFYFSFNANSNSKFFRIIIFIVRAKHSEYLLLIILLFFTPNKSIFGNISGIITAYLLKVLRILFLPKIIAIREFEKVLHLNKLFQFYRSIIKENPIMKKILSEYDIDSLNELNSFGELDTSQQMTELELLSSENENGNQNNH